MHLNNLHVPVHTALVIYNLTIQRIPTASDGSPFFLKEAP